MKELLRFLRYLKEYKGRIALSVVLVLTITGMTLPYPLIVKKLIDEALPGKTSPVIFGHTFIGWNYVLFLMGLFAFTVIARNILSYLNRYLLQEMSMRVTCDLRKDVFAHLQSLSIKYYEGKQTGQIVARVSEDTGSLFFLISSVVVSLISDAVTLVAVLFLLFWLDWRMAIPTVALLPLFLVNYRISKRRLRMFSRKHRRNWDRVVGFLHERVSSARLVKSFSMEEREIERFNRGIEADYRNFNRLTLANARLWVRADIISSFGGWMVMIIGSWYILAGKMTVGNMMAFTFYIGYLYGPIVRISDANAMVERAITALEKIYEVFDTPSFVKELPDAPDMPPVKGRVEFQNVQFSYDRGRAILSDINLHIEPGQMVALVGPSGAGKTTLINLLCRFYDIDTGAILIDGVDIRNVRIKSLRRQIGIVMQENILFSGSLLENIRYGNPGASVAMVEDAARAANIHDFIDTLPSKYFTAVGERGVKLSGGQRQRIAIARAVLTDPRILIFDEATSALDSESEKLIQDAMDRFMKGRTTIVIAHRLSTIQRADRIIVLGDGAVKEQGTHEELLALNGLYHHLHSMQFREPENG